MTLTAQPSVTASMLSSSSSTATSSAPSNILQDQTSNPANALNLQTVASAFQKSMSGGLNLQKPLFILDTSRISGEQAAIFQQQVYQWHNNFEVNQVVVNPATFAVQFATEFKLITQALVPEWYKHLTVVL